MLFRKLREKDASKYHIQLSLAMLFMLVVSLALVAKSVANVTDPYGGCVTVSVLVHYFTLVAVMWMGAEALLMFQKLVIVFSGITTKFIISVSTVCWSKYNSHNILSLTKVSLMCISICSCAHCLCSHSFHCGLGYWS